MARMMEKMNFEGKGKAEDSSDWEDASDNDKMDVDATPQMTKAITKRKKPLPRTYYEAMKKSLRRQAKCGTLPSLDRLKEMLAMDES